LTGQNELTLSRHNRHFRGQQFTSKLGPGQPRTDPDLLLLLRSAVTVLCRAQIFMQALGANGNLGIAVLLDYIYSNLAADRGNFTFEIPHTGLFRVMPDEPQNGVVRKKDILLFETVSFSLFLQQILLSDV
jgi:hypothetical protein